MEDNILIKVNRYLRQFRPFIPANAICNTFRNNSFLEIAFMGIRCPNDAHGSCIMCDYSASQSEKATNVYITEMDKILNEEKEIQYLLICTNGSILNSNQISTKTFCEILKYINRTEIPNIIIETHYNDVTVLKLDILKQLLSDKHITLELGLETINQHYQDSLIMKHISMLKFEETVSLIQDFGFNVDVNIMLGLPFLSDREQFDDTYQTISWALSHKCGPVVFPINIKDYTLLMHMYKNGFYTPVSHWLLILLLDSIETKKLSKVTIAYYGNRTEDFYGEKSQTIFPKCCSVCKDPIQKFYAQFCKEDDSYARKKLINDILNFQECNCLKDQRNKLNQSIRNNYEENYKAYANFLHKEFDTQL